MSSPGTYVLALWLPAERAIPVGSLGEIRFPAGWYLYVGSALGPGGVQARLARHHRLATQGQGKRLHWHIDHLRQQTVWGGAWARARVVASEVSLNLRCGLQATGPPAQRSECVWAAILRRRPGAIVVAPGFGASDCNCSAHLIRIPLLPSDDWFATVLGAERSVMGHDELTMLLQMLTTGGDDSREVAAMALGRFGRAAIESLTALQSLDSADARWWVARALAEVGGDGAVQPLIRALEDPDPDVRACAALALGRIGDGTAAPAVAHRLTDDSAFVAGIAADSLAMIGEPAIAALAECLGHERAHTRLLAVRALGRIRSQKAVTPLFGALEDRSYLVRYYAQEALEALGVGMVYLAP